MSGAADTLHDTAEGTWSTTGALAEAQQADFDGKRAEAWKPIASELEKRFGAVSDDTVDSLKAQSIRQFYRGVEAGIRDVSGVKEAAK